MVDIADLSDVGVLYQELRSIRVAVENFDLGGRIVQMTVSGGQNPVPDPMPDWQPGQGRPPWAIPPRQSVTVNTEYIEYPTQMVDAIRAAFDQHEQEILQRLAELAVTDNMPRVAPAPLAAAAAPSPPSQASMAKLQVPRSEFSVPAVR